MSTLEYLYFTDVGAEYLQGIQGRHLIPLAPMVFVLLHNSHVGFDLDRKPVRLAIAAYISLMLAYTLSVIYKGYY